MSKFRNSNKTLWLLHLIPDPTKSVSLITAQSAYIIWSREQNLNSGFNCKLCLYKQSRFQHKNRLWFFTNLYLDYYSTNYYILQFLQ